MGLVSTHVTSFDKDALKLFEDKGISNSEKVRRIIQLAQDLASKPFSELSVLDLGCGEGVYTLEAGIRGAKATGLDGRDNRLKFGREVAKRHQLDNVRFIVDDVRNVTTEKYGTFDVVFLLGLLYHVDEPEIFTILKNIYEVCDDVLIIDTTIALSTPISVKYNGKEYFGLKYGEHEEGDNDELTINKRVMASIGNNESFLPTKKSLVQYLNELGFTSILEAYSPLESKKTEGRITLVAMKGKKEVIASYPWMNSMTEDEIAQKIKDAVVEIPFVLKHKQTFKGRLRNSLDKFLAKRGYELKKKLKDR